MSQLGVKSVGATSADYLEDRLVVSYFEAREHETYYRSLKHADSRRDFHEAVIPILMDFVGEVLSASDYRALDAILSAAVVPSNGHPAPSDLLDDARRRHPVGFDLLQIGDRLDFDSLKSAYRRAALRNHPDKGGDHDLMVLVNEAYSLFHEMLCRSRIPESDRGAEEGFITDFDVPIRHVQGLPLRCRAPPPGDQARRVGPRRRPLLGHVLGV